MWNRGVKVMLGLYFFYSIEGACYAAESEGITLEEDSLQQQVNSVSQLRDVSPTDWAFSALQNLVERYGCISGYPDRTFGGSRPLTRHEFAAGLNSCLQQMERLIHDSSIENRSIPVTENDLATLKRLSEEFQTELTAIQKRLETLESKTAILEKNQFSTTTKLQGEVIFALTDVLTGDGTTSTFPSIFSPTGTIDVETPSQQTVFANRVRLNFLTSFTGEDQLKIRLTSGNFFHPNRPVGRDAQGQGFRYGPNPLRGYVGGLDFSPEGQQTFNDISSLPADNSVGLTALSYQLPLGKRTQLIIMGTGGEHHDYVPTTFSSWDDDNGGTGSLSVFGQRSVIYNFEGAGIGLTHHFNDQISLSAGYLASYANNPSNPTIENQFAGGLFDGRFSTLAQLSVKPSDNFSFGLTYSHSRHTVGGPVANLPIFLADQGTTSANFPVIPTQEASVNSYGFQTLWQLNPRFAVNGWFAYNQVNTSGGTDTAFGLGDYGASKADILTYGIALAFPDLFKEGNLGGIVIGASPYTTKAKVPEPFRTGGNWFGSDLGEDFTDLIAGNTIPWHIEGFYRHQFTDNISLTPGVIWLTAPNQSSRNPAVVIGTLRLTFTF